MKDVVYSGIQQIGIGVSNVYEAWAWYKKFFGFDVRVFEEAAIADLMLPYTGGEPQKRHAALAMNMQGGGGFEIWQYTDRTPQPPSFELQIGDIGIFAAKIKSPDVEKAYQWFVSQNQNIVGELYTYKDTNQKHFYVRDPYNNLFQVVPSTTWLKDEKKHTGAVYGAIIGVTDIEKAKDFYKNILGYDDVVSDQTGEFEDFKQIPGGQGKFRRVLLRHSEPRAGAFSPLLGTSKIELVQALDRTPQKIYKDRYWGDLGFIHICFDIKGMPLLRKKCEENGCPFTVDSGDTFDMGEAAGAFSYTEDPDGTLIEFVETHKVPIMKKLGWYLNLRKRDPKKSLPIWVIKAMGINRAKDIG